MPCRCGSTRDGYPAAWSHRIVSASLIAGTVLAKGPARGGAEGTVVEGVQGSPYLAAIPAVHAEVTYPTSPVTVTWLRSVGATHTAMVMEHTIDRLAFRAKIDPVEYRRTLYRRAKADKQLAVLDLRRREIRLGQAAGEWLGTRHRRARELSYGRRERG